MWTIFLLQFLKIQQLFSWKTVTTSKSNCDIEIYNFLYCKFNRVKNQITSWLAKLFKHCSYRFRHFWM